MRHKRQLPHLATNQIPPVTIALASLEGGGVQKVAVHLIREFLRLEIPTTLIAIDSSGPVRREIPDGCALIELNSHRTRWALLGLSLTLTKNKPYVLISSQTHLNVLVIIARILTGYPRKLIVIEHIAFNTSMMAAGRLLERLRPWMIKTFYPFADRIVTVSTDSAYSIYHYAKINKKIDVIENGLDLDAIQQSASQLVVGHPWMEENSGLKLIVGMGRLSPQKNFADLLHAFSLLERRENYRLIILGEGPEEDALRSFSKELNIQDCVDFPGYVENPFPLLARANLFVSSSRWEGFANVVIEALACGIPVVATDCPGGPSNILAGQAFAKIVSMGNTFEMSIAMNDLLSTDFDRSTIMEYAKNFNVQTMAQRYLDLISEL
jgi:glycosyltransferase involved in cell wall biosynthesis